MVVGLALAAVQMGMALPTGFLFGVGYGTGVRIGYEQVYPLLFPKGARPTTTELAATMKGMNTVYDAIGGKDASRMGIAVGITNAGEILNNPDFRVLEQLESSSSGLTSSSSSRSRFGLDQESPQEALSSKIEQFNIDTHADHEAQFRQLTTLQLLNAYQTKNLEHKAIIGRLLSQRQLSPEQTSQTSSFVSNVTSSQLAAAKLLREDQAWTTWSLEKGKRITNISKMKAQIQFNIHKGAASATQSQKDYIALQRRVLVRLSNDYRSSNNNIRLSALALRKHLAAGQYKL